ncbi:MAG TPA: GvpL/GvpF family gas vesicle protein, partial [Ktedonobacterales bacterium]|nr:GvpL/GvpF family gas vesicle protein [Ktedonobacterales bacterium]
SIHRLHAILPSKFGCVYPDEQGLREALSGMAALLIDRLEYVADCDEWTVYLYADHPTLERQLVESDPGLQRFQREVAAATAGRAYLLKRKLADELDNVRERALSELARAQYEYLSRYARAGIEQTPSLGRGNSQGEIELLRAVFLVPRADLVRFLDAANSIITRVAGLRGESSGPWPPYSFATLVEEQLGDEQHA